MRVRSTTEEFLSTKPIFEETRAHGGNFIKLLLPVERVQVTSKDSITRRGMEVKGGQIQTLLIHTHTHMHKSSCKCLTRYQQHQSHLLSPPPIRSLSLTITQPTATSLSTENHKIRTQKSVAHSPISLSDLLSISVSVSVSAELERLERQEFCPDLAPVPHRDMVRSGDTGSWFSEAKTVPLE